MTHQANNQKMMKMRFNILTTLVLLFTLAVGQSWGEAVTILSYTVDESSSSTTGVVQKTASGSIGGTVEFNITGTTGTTAFFRQEYSAKSYYFGASAAYVKISLANGEKFKTGDVIKFSIYSTNANTQDRYRGLNINKTNTAATSNNASPGIPTKNTWTENTFTLTSDFNDAEELYLKRDNAVDIKNISVTREVNGIFTEYTSSANGSTRDVANTGTSYTIPSGFVAGPSGTSLNVGGKNDNGVKLRTSNGSSISNLGIGKNYYAIEVKPGYKITGIDFQFANNYANTSTITGIYVDGDYSTNKLSTPLTSGTDKAKANGSVSGLEATEKIVFAVTTGNEVTGNQQNFLAKITYEEIPVVVKAIESLSINGLAISSANITTLNTNKTITINDVYTSVPTLAVSTTDHLEPVVGAPVVDGKQYTYSFSYNEEDYTVVLSNVNLPNNEATLLYTIAQNVGGTLDEDHHTWTSADGKLVVDYSKKSNNFDSGAQLNGYKFYDTQLDFTAPAGYAIDYIQISGYTNSAGNEIPLTVTGSGIVSPTYSKYKGTSTQSNIDVINYIDETPTAGEQYSVYFGTPQSNGSKVLIYGHEVQEPEPVSWKDIKMDFTGEDSFITQVAKNFNIGIAVAEDGTVSAVATDSQDSKATLTGNYHGTQHGVNSAKLVVPVTGSVKISIGCNNNGTKTWTVTDGNGAEVVTFSNAGNVYTTGSNDVAVAYYDGPATTLTINGSGTYTGYIAVEEIDPALVPCLVSFTNNDGAVEGTLPASNFVSKGSQFTIPVNYRLYKERYTLKKWEDAEGNKYTPGQQITPSKNIKLTPVFTQNTVSLADRTTDVPIKWALNKANYCNYSVEGNGNDPCLGFFVAQASVNGETIDVKLDIDATNGKFGANNDSWTQVKTGTIFKMPSANGAAIEMKVFGTLATATIDGSTKYTQNGGIVTYNVTSGNNPVSVVADDKMQYIEYIQVVLPAARVATPVITDANGNVTITCATDGAAIYYTTDGTDPTSASTLYNNTFTLENNATVKAIAVKDGLTDSKVASKDVTGSLTVVHTWDFTKWSEATKTNLEAEHDKAEGNWSRKEKTTSDPVTGCYWQVTHGKLFANGQEIEELKGLEFINTNDRGLAIATNYGSTSLGTYHGSQYLWLGGSEKTYFTIKNVKVGSTIRMGVESHKLTPADARGVKLSVASNPDPPTTYTEQEWTVTGTGTTTDVTVTNTNGCHIYWIDAEIGQPEWETLELTLNKAGLLTAEDMTKVDGKYPDVEFGISVDGSGKVIRVAADAPNAIGVVTGNYHSDHGMNPFSMTLKVPEGKIKITAGTCSYGTTQIKVDGTNVGDAVVGDGKTTCWKNNPSNLATGEYECAEGTITITTGTNEPNYNGGYTPYIRIDKVHPVDPSDPGYIVVNNIEELKAAIIRVNGSNTSTESPRSTIFIKNGTYDFGTEVHVRISGHNVSFIGESLKGVILKTAPDKSTEGLTSASFIELTGSGCYFQDLTLQNALDYYGTGSAGRAGVIWDKSDKTIYKNVRMLSYQDTYYTNSSGKYRYFEGGEIHGTVDYICGSGDVFFKDVKLVNESRSRDSKSGEDVITAQNRGDNNDNPIESDRGYVFDGCTIESNCATFLFGRSWHHARTVFMNTTIKSGTLNSHRWDPAGMNSVPDYFYEYNTKNAVGTVVTPSSKVINFTHSSGNASLETVINATQAANYSLANFFTDWTPNTLAAQVEATGITINGKELTFPEGTYLVEKEDGTFAALVKGTSYTIPDNDHYTLRRANEMGGFGPKSEVFPEKLNYPINATWDFTKNAPSRYSSLSGSIQSNVGDKLNMALTGSLRDNANAIQLNVGATLTIPVSSTRDVITVENYGGSTHNAVFDIGNRTKVEGNCTYSPQPSEVEAGYVTITITGAGKAEDSKNNNYINKISALLKGPADQPVQEGNWMRYLDNGYQDATESDWVWLDTDPTRQGLLSIGVEEDNKFSKQEIKAISGNRAARYDLSDIVDITEVDAWKIEWDAKLQQGVSNNRSQSLFAIRSTGSGNDAINPTKTYMYLGCDLLLVDGYPTDNGAGVGNANRSKTWYFKNNDGTKIPLTTGFTDFTLDNTKWYHYKFTYNGKDARVLITDNEKVVADASYELDLPVGNLKDLFSTVGRSTGEADVDNITFAIYNQKPAFITDLSTETIEAKTDYATKLKVEAEGAISYQWFKSTTNDISTGTPIDGATGTTLVVTPEEEGEAYYYVMATNSLGVTISHVAKLNITKPIPEITKLEFGSFDFSKKKFKVNVEGIGDIHLKFDNAAEYVDYDEDDQSNIYALNTVTAYATTKEGQSMPVTLTQPIEYDPAKPFAAWVYTKSYVNSTTKAELDHEAQNQPITRKIRELCNLINVEFPDESKVYGQTHPSLNRADLIVFSEMVVGGTTLANSFEPLIGNVPFLNFKAYNYGIEKSRWKWGEPGQEDDYTAIAVKANNPWLKMFDGVNIIDNSTEPAADNYGTPVFEVCDKSNGAWNDAIKHLQWIDGASLSSTLPTVKAATTFTNYAKVADNKIFMHGFNPVAGSESVDALAPYILFALNFDNAQAVSEDAITIAGNLARMMLNNESFDTATSGLKPEITDNGDGSAHITSNIYKGIIYYKVEEENAEAPTFDAETWQQVDANGNTAKQVAGNWKVYSVVKFPESLTDTPAGVTIPTGVSEMGEGTIVGTDIRIVHFRAGTSDEKTIDPVTSMELWAVPSEFSVLSKGDEAKIGSDYKIPMNVSLVKAEPGKENEPVRPYYTFSGWAADQNVKALLRTERPQGFDPYNPPPTIPYPNEPKVPGTLLPTTTFVQMPEHDLTFETRFRRNMGSLQSAEIPTLVTWDFTRDGVLYDRTPNGGGGYNDGTYTPSHLGADVWGAQEYTLENEACYYNRLSRVKDMNNGDESQLTETQKYIDVPLFLDARNVTGANNQVFQVSFNNTESATSVKTKDGMIFGIPAVYGMQIKLLGTDGTTFGGANSKTTVGGELINATEHKLLKDIFGAGSETVTMTYMGKKDYLFVELYEGNANADILMKGISVIYPARVNITPQVKVGDAVNNEAGKIIYKPVYEEIKLTETAPFTANVADTLIAKAAYGYKFIGWYDNAGNAIETGIISTEKDGNENVIASTLEYTPTATGNITAKFQAIGKVKMQVTTYRNTPADTKTPNLELNGRTVSNDKGEFATFEFSATQLGETVVFEPTYNEDEKCYEIEVTPGTEVTVHGVQIPGNRFKKWSKWTEDAGVWTETPGSIVTENPHTFTVSEATKYYVQYEDVSGGYMVTYQNGGETITVPLMQNSMYEYAAPKYHTAYKEGYSLLGWQNSKKNYFIYQYETKESNAVITGQTRGSEGLPLEGVDPAEMDDDLQLTPIYAQNNSLAKLAGRKEAVTVTWDFTQAQRAQVMNFPVNSNGTYVARAAVKANDNKYYSCDVPMTFATGKRGRINNTSSAEWCTMGQGTTLTVPVCKGAKVTFVTRSAISANDGGTRINGAVPALESESADGKVYIYNVTEDLESVDVVLGKDYSYYKSLSVNLPPVSQKHEVALIASDLTDLSTEYSFDASKKTFKATGTGETLTLKTINGTFNIYPTSSMSSSSQYVAGEKGYMHCPKDGQGFTVTGMKNVTRICFRQGARINTGNAWKVVANPGGKNAKGDAAKEVVLLADHKSTVPEWIEINDIYLDNDPVIAFYNLSYQENKVDKSTTAGPYDIYLFNLEMYGIAETTDAQMTLEVGGKLDNNGTLTDGGGTVGVKPYTMCMPTEEEQTQFHNSAVRPVEGLEHYATPRRTMQFDEGTEVVMTAEPNFGYEFQSWIDTDGNVVSTKNPYTFEIHENKKIYAKYNTIGHIIYTFGGENYEGSVPGEQQTERGQFKVPANLTLFKDDNSTLAYWINPDDPTAEKAAEGVKQEHYELMKTYAYGENNDHFTGYDVYLSPVFAENSFTLLDVESPATVRWPFGQKSGAPEFNIESRTGFEMGQVKKSSTSNEFIDIRMSISALKQANGGTGKVNNVGRTDDYAQVNQNTVFTFPMTKGMKLVVSSDNNISKSKFGGATPNAAGKTATFYSGHKGDGKEFIGGNEIDDVQLYINDGSQNFKYIEATYYPRLKQPVFATTSAPSTSATVSVSAPTTSGATNEKIYYTISKDGRMPADPTISSSTVISGGSITETFENGMPIIIKAINIADNRPDSKITTYAVLPFDENKNTAVYFFNSEDKDYDMGADPVFRNLMVESVGKFNVVPYNIRAGVPGEGDIKNHITNDKVKAYIVADKDKNNSVVTGINTSSKPVVSLHNVLDNIVTWNTEGTEFTLKNTDNDNLAIFDKVLIAYNETANVNDKVCVSNTGSLTHSGVNYNAAYIIGNATKALVLPDNPDKPVIPETLWATTTTTEPQVRKQMFAGKYVSAFSLGLLSGGVTTYPVDVWSDAIQVAATAEEGTGYIGYEQPTAGNMQAVVKLYSDEQKTQEIRKYTINLQMMSNKDGLVYTEKDYDAETQIWNNGTWSINQSTGNISGNDGECFKFNNPVDLTITGPANYGIKSVTFHGYDFVAGAAGGAQISSMTATTVEGKGSMASSVGESTIKKYNNNEYQNHVDGDLKLDFPLTSTNTTTIRLEGGHQWIGSIQIEYFERMTSAINITKADLGETKKEPLTLPSNGHVSVSFNSVMAEVTTSQDAKVTISGGNLTSPMALSADGNLSSLTFYYWNLGAGDYNLTIPFAALKDIYGTAYTGTDSDDLQSYKSDDKFVIPFSVDAKNYVRRKFDFIVNDRDHSINWDGSHIVGLNTVGGNDSDERKYMLFLNSKDEYFIATGEQANKDNKTSTIFTDVDNNGIMNGRTRLTAKNLSLIGESQRNEKNAKGVIITSKPKEEGSSSTPTIEFKLKSCTDNYIQDLTICNSWPYNATNFAGRATAMLDNGTNTIMKNVRLESWQDTYYTQGVRGYNEDCTFMGVVDFIYGHGDYWFKNCNIVLRDRIGNNIVAANTSPGEKWGYVFDDCTIDKEYGATLVSSGSFTLGRPWQNSPAATFLNTKMMLTPTKQGWTQMSEGLVVRYHEYGSMDEAGNLLNISTRSIAGLSPAKGSDSPVLTEAEAAKFNIHTVLGGDNGFDPQEHTRQIPKIESMYVDGQSLYWKDDRDALCYFVYYLGDGTEPNTDDPILVANIAPEFSKEVGFNLFENNHVFRGTQTFDTWYLSLPKSGTGVKRLNDEFTHGWFAVRAANQRGGLNEMSNVVEYHKVREYKARVTTGGKVSGDDSGNVWSTIYLDFNAKVPEGVFAYALTDVTAFGGKDVTETTIYLKRVSNEVAPGHQDIVYKNMGYILYGPGPEHSSRTNEYHFIETGHMNVVDGEEESRTDFTKSYLSGTIGNFKGIVSSVAGVVGETGEKGWSSYYLDYTDVPVGYTSAYTLSTKTVEGTSFGLGFYKYNGSTFGHHKAFLDTDEVSRLLTAHNVDAQSVEQALSKGFCVVIRDGDDEVTQIIRVEGKEVYDLSGSVYDVLGKRVTPAAMRKGEVYIINGKKIRF